MSQSLNANNVHTMFAGNPLNRMDNYRTDAKLWEKWQADSKARFALIQCDKVSVNEDYTIRWHKLSELEAFQTGDRILLGLDGNDIPHFAVSLMSEEENESLKDLRSLAFHAPPAKAATDTTQEIAMVAQGKSMLDWHRSHQYCSKCGTKSDLVKMGYERKCSSCDTSHFPRTDPVVIMLGVHRDSDSILVGRPPNLFEGVYTALAGFMEPGETIEEACARELFEETGVKVTKAHYIASQPWPYPSTLMIGCIAEVEGKDLTIDYDELEDARWFTREEAQSIFEGKTEGLFFPPHLAIARQLVDYYLSNEDF